MGAVAVGVVRMDLPRAAGVVGMDLPCAAGVVGKGLRRAAGAATGRDGEAPGSRGRSGVNSLAG